MVRRKVALTIGVGGTLGGGILLASNLFLAGAATAVPLAANAALILGGAMFLREFRQTTGAYAMMERVHHRWYPRPVFFVADLSRSLRFYLDQLGFTKKWHEANGAGTVCQVDRSDCEIILCQEPTRRTPARLFVELTPAGLRELRRELDERAVPHALGRWGYEVLEVVDPDGNELLFPIEDA
jgi:catechol 2,3-dioxygenase-like lactoylglutathione lyase family enzyme